MGPPSNLKTEVSASDFEAETHDIELQSKTRIFLIVDRSRVALTAVGLVVAIAALGLSADLLSVYNNTHVPADFLLPLWPENFDIRPTNALIAGSVIVMLVNGFVLLTSLIQSLRKFAIIRTTVNLGAPVAALIAALVAMIFFYAVNASNSTHTVQSWSCQWKDVAMLSQPYFGTMCKQSKAGLALGVFLVPLEIITLGVSAAQFLVGKQIASLSGHRTVEKRASPALS